MFFNYDSIEIIAIGFVVAGVFTYFYSTSSPLINNESLVNTNSKPSELSTNLVDVAIQTEVNIPVEAVNTYVNTGVQTSARMWLESIRNRITEILGGGASTSSHSGPGYVDVGVQTNALTTWGTVKQWFLEVCSIRSSDLSSMGYNKVEKWRNNLNSIQSVDLHNSESPLTSIVFGSPDNSSLDKLVDPGDSLSQVSEVVSESNLQNVETANRVYDMSNRQDVLDLMNDPTVLFGINGAYDPADDLITFITQDASYDILRSTLDTLLNSVN